MKDFITRSMLFAALLIVVGGGNSLHSQSFECDGLYYNVIDGNEVEVSGCTAELTDLVIPVTVTDEDKTYIVTRIGDAAFAGNEGLISVTFPESLISIGQSAFYGTGLTSVNIHSKITDIGSIAFSYCSSLYSINVDEGNPNYISQDGVLFTKDMEELICYPCARDVRQYVVPSGVVTVADDAFAGSLFLTSVKLPSTLKNIGGEAFAECSALVSIVIPESVTYIADDVFAYCYGLKSVAFLSESLSLSEYSFYDCGNIDEIFLFNCKSLAIDDTDASDAPILFGETDSYTFYIFDEISLPEQFAPPVSTVRLSLGGLSAKMPYTGKFPDLYIEGNTSSYKMMVDESSMTFDTAPGTHTLDSFGFWLYKEGEEANKTLVTINQPITYTIDGAGIDDAAASGIDCYPGIADDMLTVSGTAAGMSLRIVDMSGAQRMSVACTDGETAVDVSGLAQGMYFVLVEGGGDVTARLRFVKK